MELSYKNVAIPILYIHILSTIISAAPMYRITFFSSMCEAYREVIFKLDSKYEVKISLFLHQPVTLSDSCQDFFKIYFKIFHHFDSQVTIIKKKDIFHKSRASSNLQALTYCRYLFRVFSFLWNTNLSKASLLYPSIGNVHAS